MDGRSRAASDIRLDGGPGGRPAVVGGWKCELPWLPPISIAHTDGMVVAAAAGGSCRLGVDTERIQPPSQDFLDGAFSAGEMANIPGNAGEERSEWILRAWAAKEAVGKALGSGVPYNPRELAVQAVDAATGTVTLRASGKMLAAAGAADGSELTAETFRQGDHVLAIAALAGSI